MLRNFDFTNRWTVISENRGGGLVLLWKDTIDLIVVDLSKYYIDAFVDKFSEQAWRFTGFYGELVTWRR